MIWDGFSKSQSSESVLRSKQAIPPCNLFPQTISRLLSLSDFSEKKKWNLISDSLQSLKKKLFDRDIWIYTEEYSKQKKLAH